jgi:hypothetical protein
VAGKRDHHAPSYPPDVRALSSRDKTVWRPTNAAADFVLAFAVVHEMPSAAKFFAEAARATKSGARLLLAEPVGHVNKDDFETNLRSPPRPALQQLSDRPFLVAKPRSYREPDGSDPLLT